MFYLTKQFSNEDFFNLMDSIDTGKKHQAFLSGSFFSFLTLNQFLFKQEDNISFMNNIKNYMSLKKRDLDVFYLSKQEKIVSTIKKTQIKKYHTEINYIRLKGKDINDKINHVANFDEHWLKFFYDFKTQKVYFALNEMMLFQLRTNQAINDLIKDKGYEEEYTVLLTEKQMSFSKKNCLTKNKQFFFFLDMLYCFFKDTHSFFDNLKNYRSPFFENENKLLNKKAVKNLLRKHKKMNDFFLNSQENHFKTLLVTIYLDYLFNKKNKHDVYFRDNVAKNYTKILDDINEYCGVNLYTIKKDKDYSIISIKAKKVSKLDLFKKFDLNNINLSLLNYLTEDNAIILVE